MPPSIRLVPDASREAPACLLDDRLDRRQVPDLDADGVDSAVDRTFGDEHVRPEVAVAAGVPRVARERRDRLLEREREHRVLDLPDRGDADAVVVDPGAAAALGVPAPVRAPAPRRRRAGSRRPPRARSASPRRGSRGSSSASRRSGRRSSGARRPPSCRTPRRACRRPGARRRAARGSPPRPPGRPRSPGSGRASSRREIARAEPGERDRVGLRRRARARVQGRGSREPRSYSSTALLRGGDEPELRLRNGQRQWLSTSSCTGGRPAVRC